MKTLTAINTERAGLGNRMQFTLSAREVADKEDREFSYFWPTSELFEPLLDELWDFPPSVVSLESTAIIRDRRTTDLTQIRDEENWFIRGFTEVKVSDKKTRIWGELLQELTPVEEIQNVIATWKQRLPEKYYGVQIRANNKAHAKTLEKSPVEWYERRIKEILIDNPEAAFFVSCDVPEVQEGLESKFPSLMGITDKGPYNSTSAVRAAIADLYLLAGSARMLTAYWSSFPEMAHALSGFAIPLENSVTTIPAAR